MCPTESFLEGVTSSASRLRSLRPGVRVCDVADACRSAALGFAWSAHHGWGRRELARWLVGPYARAVAATRSLPTSGTRRAVVVAHPLDEAAVTTLLETAHAQLIEVLRSAWSWKYDAASVRARIDERLVAGVTDDASNLGFAPVDGVNMRLIDRLRSLFVADYLTRPADYAAFAVCNDCLGVTFDGALDHVNCMRPRTRTVLRRRAPQDVALPGEPELHLPASLKGAAIVRR